LNKVQFWVILDPELLDPPKTSRTGAAIGAVDSVALGKK
jgi:hypothetical protein